MRADARSWLSRPHLLRRLLTEARLAVRLFREPAVSAFAKVVPVLGALYLVDPIDFVPDVLPIVGQVDDLAVAIAALQLFVRLAPRAAAAFHEAAIAGGRRYSPMPRSGFAGERTAASGQRSAASGDRSAASGERPGDVIDAEWRRD